MMRDEDYPLNSGEFESQDYYLGSSPPQLQNVLIDNVTEANFGIEEGAEMELQFSPNLIQVTDSLRWAFWLHAYGFACLFFFLAFYSFFSILNLRSQLSTRPYMTTINSFLCLLGASRAAVLFIDPYGLEDRMPSLMGTLLWDLGFPSLISSFSLIQIAFLQLTQVDVGPETFRKKTCLSLVITLHFVSLIISAIYTNLNPHLIAGKQVTQLFFAVWGFILCGTFLVAGNRIFNLLGIGSRNNDNESNPMGSVNDKGIANLFGMGMLGGGGGGQNLASSLTAALAPTLLQGGNAGTSTSSQSNVTTMSNASAAAATKNDKDAPKIRVTDENERTFSLASVSDPSRLNDIPELPETTGGGFSGQVPVQSPRGSFSAQGGDGDPAAGMSSTYVRPPSPVLPRRKSSGPGLRALPAGAPRRLSWNRRDSGGGELLATTPNTDKETRKKSLTWSEMDPTDRVATTTGSLDKDKRRPSRKSFDTTAVDSERNGGTETLLSTAVGVGGTDYTLQSILSHIAYVNQTALDYRLSRKLSRTNQVEKVVKYTSVTALLGVAICIMECIRLLSPFGLLASTTPPSVWMWFTLNTVYRFLEFGMGATIANIAKQPVNRPHHMYSIRHKHQRESLYL